MFKQEQGFSLVELAIAAGLAVALAATAVTILSGTTASLSSKANGAAGTSTQYNYDVLNDGGTPSNPTVAAPATPASVVAGNVTQTTATLTWNAVSGATSYVAFINGEIAATLAANTTSYDYTGLTAGTGYTLAVVAVNAGGNSSAAEAVISTPVAIPASPTGVTASSIASTSATITWNNVSGATSYIVSVGGVAKATLDSTATSYTFTGLTASTAYTLSVAASNVSGTSNDSQANITTNIPTPASAPVIDPLYVVYSDLFWISWSAVSGATSYNVYINGALVASISDNTGKTFNGAALTNGATLTVKPVNAGGEGPAASKTIVWANGRPSLV